MLGSKTVLDLLIKLDNFYFVCFLQIRLLNFDFDLIFRVRVRLKSVLGSTHKVEKLLFSMYPFTFDLIFGLVLALLRIGVKNWF